MNSQHRERMLLSLIIGLLKKNTHQDLVTQRLRVDVKGKIAL